jgi:hypothetical protein
MIVGRRRHLDFHFTGQRIGTRAKRKGCTRRVGAGGARIGRGESHRLHSWAGDQAVFSAAFWQASCSAAPTNPSRSSVAMLTSFRMVYTSPRMPMSTSSYIMYW